VAPDQLHLTLHFIGPVARERLDAVTRALAVPCRRFELVLDQAAVWPNGVAVVQPSKVPPALSDLHRALGDALDRAGLPRETRTFRPHVTLARHAQGATPVPGQPARWQVKDYALVESAQGYRVLHRFN
jgi:2'-5' RNA ligase